MSAYIRCNRIPAGTRKLNNGETVQVVEHYELRTMIEYENDMGGMEVESQKVREFSTFEDAQAYANEHYGSWEKGGLLR
jgi:hypothetical protein